MNQTSAGGNCAPGSNRPQVLVVGLLPPLIGGVATCVKTFLEAPGLQAQYKLSSHDPTRGLPAESGFCGLWRRGFLFLMRCLGRNLKVEQRLDQLKRKLDAITDLRLVHLHSSSFESFRLNARLVEELHRQRITFLLQMHGGGFREFFDQASIEEQEWIRRILNLPSGLIVLSEQWRSFYQHLVPEQEIFLLPNPIQDKAEPRLVQHPEAVFFLGHLTRNKGVEDLLAAWQKVRISRPEAELWLAGPDLEQIMSGISVTEKEKLGIKYFGLVLGEEKRKLFHQAALLTLPSYYEGLPIVLLEAMAMGLPVVATPVGAVPEVLTDGEEGLLVPVGEIDQLASALLQLLKNPELRQSMGQLGFDRVSQKYHIDVLSVTLAEIYQQTIEKGDHETGCCPEQ
ncbi:MAG: glycosyltransferase family 4 protein [Candidatus Delongbacteria bacterium]|nr:glycosyltransferase family 4 protein [Candidatus Delongbacteria bacterium]